MRLITADLFAAADMLRSVLTADDSCRVHAYIGRWLMYVTLAHNIPIFAAR